MENLDSHIQSAQIVLSCRNLNETLDLFVEKLGFRVKTIFPADSPVTAVISGHGVTLRLETKDEIFPVTLQLLCDLSSFPVGAPTEILVPDGIRIKFVEINPPVFVPKGKQEFVLSRMTDESSWVTGRAGMKYRDLIPGRLGGLFIASHIRIPQGGKVSDYVHYHKVRFQMIYCKAGWVRVVYEDQGAPFVLYPGDCVLQPPEIRHRVLANSPGLEVIEISCPAVHETFADHNLELPTAQSRPERLFNGQKFVHHIPDEVEWNPSYLNGFEERDLGIAAATNGLAEVRVLRANSSMTAHNQHSGEFLFYFVLKGRGRLTGETLGNHQLTVNDSCTIPPGAGFALEADEGFEVLEVYLPSLD